MNMINQIILEGNVTEEREMESLPDGAKKFEFPIAVKKYYKNADGELHEEISCFDVLTMNKLAETCKSHCKKDRGVRIVGHLKQIIWTDNEEKKHSKIVVIADHIEFKFLEK